MLFNFSWLGSDALAGAVAHRSSSPNGRSVMAAASAAAAAAASAASFQSGILPSIPLMEMMCAPQLGGSAEEQQLLLCSVTGPLHGDGMATLVHPLRSVGSGASDASGLLGVSYGADGGAVSVAPAPTHTADGVPLSALVADGSAAAVEVADQSFADFARDVWPGLGVGRLE